MNQNLYTQIESVFQAATNRRCIVLGDGKEWSYVELEVLVHRTAGVLTELGVNQNDRVIAQTGKCVDAIALYLACLQLGAIYVPLNTAYTNQELQYFVNDTRPHIVVTETENIHAGLDVPCLLTLNEKNEGTLHELTEACNSFVRAVASANENDVAAILYTSGTTGRSKGAMLTHRNLLSNAKTLLNYWGWQADDVLLHALPIFHVHGLFVALHCVLLSGTSMIFQARFDVDALINALPNATVLMGVPTFYTRLLDHPDLNQDTLRNMRLFISGSAPLSEQTFQTFFERTGMKILERYGMSETLMNTSNPLHGERIAGTVGFPLPELDVRIANADGQELPVGKVGGIELKGPNVFAGYWKMPDKTAEEFRADGFFKTGDMGVQDQEGRIAIVGRAKDVVISGGYNVYPAEVEAAIDQIAGVTENAVIGVPHPDFGEGVVAVVVAEHELSLATVDAALHNQIARFKQPKAIRQLDELPRNAMGKVQKNELRQRFADIFTAGEP